jgi:hypothetical protein
LLILSFVAFCVKKCPENTTASFIATLVNLTIGFTNSRNLQSLALPKPNDLTTIRIVVKHFCVKRLESQWFLGLAMTRSSMDKPSIRASLSDVCDLGH